MTDPDVPRGIALAWGAVPQPQRGPKREFRLDQVLDAAMALADADDITAVTMPSVAQALGLTAMSLYRYVVSKETLLLLLQDHGMGSPPPDIAGAAHWRAGLTAYAKASEEVYRSHPWMLDIPISGIATTPNNLSWMEAGLAALRHTALSMHERLSIVLQVSGHARFRALVERGYRNEPSADASEIVLSESRMITRLATAERFPQLLTAIDSGALSTGPSDSFDFGLALLLDGVEHRLSAKR